ncbi:WXG100-like domain-containing protein [Streptomyces halobius]|uniref:Outer membrane channel protein CpnT-like N-terminal domain-containing protein n=1 Tax=Streptomyces halobius TaxID=2879846 RepID=A0ABY4MGN6_9ACTN|nr:hypothetical protein [Streptomyces halobius]UQA95879.1 hypothetical protein K9S39_32000 [Streptomyces halobius]
MSFRVQPGDISAYGGMIGRAEENMAAAQKFLRDNSELGVGSGDVPGELWQLVVGNHEPTVDKAQRALKAFENALRASAAELKRSAKYYEQTDQEQAEKVDGIYKGGRGPTKGAASDVGDGTFKDQSDAAAALDTSESFSEYLGRQIQERKDGLIGDRAKAIGEGNALTILGTALDLVSPTTLVNEAVKFFLNIDVFGEVAKKFAGDWGAYETAADTWGRLGQFFTAVGDNVSSGNNLLSRTWEGNAAETAWEYFNTLAQKLSDATSSYETLQESYKEVATHIAELAEGVKAAMIMIFDLAIMAQIEMSAAVAAASTGVGLILSGVGAAAVAAKVVIMLDKWADIINMFTVGYAVINAAFGVAGNAVDGQLDSVKSFPLPGGAYDHQAV